MVVVCVQQEMLQKLIELQQDLVGIDSLLQPNRVCVSCCFFALEVSDCKSALICLCKCHADVCVLLCHWFLEPSEDGRKLHVSQCWSVSRVWSSWSYSACFQHTTVCMSDGYQNMLLWRSTQDNWIQQYEPYCQRDDTVSLLSLNNHECSDTVCLVQKDMSLTFE